MSETPDSMTCSLCGASVAAAAYFCSACGDLIRTPPEDAPVAGPWRAILRAHGEARDTVFGAPAVVLPDDGEGDGDTAPAPRAAPADEDDLPDLFEGDLDPPEGFRETGWFLDGEDPDALSAIENRDVPAEDLAERYRPENVVVSAEARRRLSLTADPEEDEA